MKRSDYCKIARFERETRYYTLLLEKDLLGDWVITRVNGGIDSRLGRVLHEPVYTIQQGLKRFDVLARYREEARHYQKVYQKEFSLVIRTSSRWLSPYSL